MAKKYQWFNGVKFTRDDDTGYYLNSTLRKRMHIFVWEFYNGTIQSGYEIHHKDLDKSNNDISNLELLSVSDHKKLHASLLTDQQRQSKRDNLNNNARPKAIEWHKSDVGKAWHKEHYNNVKDKLHKQISFTCLWCHTSFIGDLNSKFCSNACKSAYRRASGVDMVDATCVVCGNIFKTNKYRKAKCCTKKCSAILGHMSR